MESSALRNYAEALYLEASERGDLEPLLGALRELATALGETPELKRVLEHPGVDAEEKLRLLETILGGERPAGLEGALRLLTARHHLTDLPALARLLRLVQQERAGRQPVRVEASAALSEEQAARLRVALGRLVGREVELTVQVVPELLGGLRVQVNSEVLDESLVGRLRRVEEFLAQGGPGPETAGDVRGN